MLIVVPFSRIQNAERIHEMWKAQTVKCDLVAIPKDGCPDFLPHLGPQNSIARALNAGIQYAKQVGHPWIAFWDDDNYYGPSYCEHMQREEFDVVTQGVGFVRHDDGLYHYGNRIRFCPTHSTAVKTETVPLFPEHDGRYHHDELWSTLIDPKRTAHVTGWHSVYYRTSGHHACALSTQQFMSTFGPATYLGEVEDCVVDHVFSIKGPLAHRRNQNPCAKCSQVHQDVLSDFKCAQS
jgi:hypothetical protein